MRKYFFITIIFILIIILTMLSRSAFAATLLGIEDISSDLPTNGDYQSRSLHQITGLAIHHSAVDGQNAYDYANYHISRGWPGIGYHFVIDTKGNIFQTNPLTKISYHVSGNNTKLVGICLSGNHDRHPPTTAQLLSARKLIRYLRRLLPNTLTVKGHNHYVLTSCPGKYLDLQQLTKPKWIP